MRAACRGHSLGATPARGMSMRVTQSRHNCASAKGVPAADVFPVAPSAKTRVAAGCLSSQDSPRAVLDRHEHQAR